MKNADWLSAPLIFIALYGYLAVSEVWGKGHNNKSVECVKAGGRWVQPEGCGSGGDYCERGGK